MNRKIFYRALDAVPYPLPRSLWSGSKDMDQHRVAYISGSPRSGTTWVAEMVEGISGSRRFFEPCKGFFQKHQTDFGSRVKGGYTPHIGSGEQEEAALAAYIKAISKGEPPAQATRAFDPNRGVIENLRRIRRADCTLLKFTKMQRCVPWMSFNVDLRGAVIMRNPLSTVSSMMRNAPNGYKADIDVLRFSNALLEILPGLSDFHGKEATRLQRLTVMVCLDMLVPLRSPLGPFQPVFVNYDDLCEKPELFRDLVLALGLDVENPDRIAMSKKPSSTTKAHSNVLRGGDPRTSWKRNLTDEDVATIESISERLGVDFYTESLALNKPKVDNLGIKLLGY